MDIHDVQEVELNPIGVVSSGREQVEDDYWGPVISVMEIRPKAVCGTTTRAV